MIDASTDPHWWNVVPLGQVEGARLAAWATPGSLAVVLLGVALLLTMFGLFRAVMERRRLRSGIRLLGEATSSLAEHREFSAVALGRDRDLAAIGEAFNHISRLLREDAGKVDPEVTGSGNLASYFDRYEAMSAEMSGITDGAELHRTLVRALVERFEFAAAGLWLLHRYVKGEAVSLPESREEGGESDGGKVLAGVGLLPASRFGPGFPDSGADAMGYSQGGVIEAAMSGAPVVCDNFATSPLFSGAADELGDRGVHAYAAMPLQRRGRVIGVLEVFSSSPLTPVERRFLGLIAARATSLISLAHGEREAAEGRDAYESQNLELQMANRQLQRTNSQLAEADRLKGEFLANTSHELRTPLNSILGFAQLILAGACDSEEEMRSNVEAIHESGERLLKLINEVLDLAKIEAGRLNLSLTPVDVRPVIDAAYTLLLVQAEAKGVELLVDIPRTELSPVRADHTKLYQILVNLIGNAVKFTEAGSVTVRVIPESLPGFMVIEVADTGIGVSPEVLSRLFQKFVQGDGSVTRKFGGTGLGLAISQKMADLQGGALTLSSAGEGKGAVAKLVVPLWSDRLEVEVSRNSIRPRPGELPPSRTLVVIEDYLEFQRYMVEILESRGWHVLAARTAREGLDLIQDYVPAAVILDVHLPWDEEDATVRSGYDVVRILGRDSDLNSIPILIVTGMLREAADRLLTQTVINPVELYGKPLNEEAFFEALGRLTAGEKRLSPTPP
jgi:signal transduction histidine kinase/CheY-like chemotaxis protein